MKSLCAKLVFGGRPMPAATVALSLLSKPRLIASALALALVGCGRGPDPALGSARHSATVTASCSGDDVPPVAGTIGPGGGKVSRLYFAVVGNTRPPFANDAFDYPTVVIKKIYADIESMTPRPEFVIATGNYMFATTDAQARTQILLYQSASSQFEGPVFAAMGNHECSGPLSSNCAGAPTSSYKAYFNGLVSPLGQALPYYSIPIADEKGEWTAKVIVTACNDWEPTQANWLQNELAKPTTYTFVVRHEQTIDLAAPCVVATNAMLAQANYDLLIVGEPSQFRYSNRELVIGNGGAPLSGSSNYGYATIDQQQNGSLLVTAFDYWNNDKIATYCLPPVVVATKLTLTGPDLALIANDGSFIFSAVLTDAFDGTPIANEPISFQLGTQVCPGGGITNAAGVATCTIANVSQPLGPASLTASFAHDGNFQAATAQANALVFEFLKSGAFVIGDSEAPIKNSVTYWSAQWWKENALSGGAAPAAFKGFAEFPARPDCGTAWTSDPGNSSGPPASVPGYMAVIASNSIQQSGSTISGDSPMIVIVQTEPGYSGAPGHAGTGTVVGVLCGP
jgi:hypothetical protein